MREKLLELLQTWQRTPVLIIGDVCEDIWQPCKRKVNDECYTLEATDMPTVTRGMAAVVATNVHSLGGQSTLLHRGRRPTRTRFVREMETIAGGAVSEQTIGRVDTNPPAIQMAEQESLTCQAVSAIRGEGCRAVLIADHGIGTVSDYLLGHVLSEAKRAEIPVVVDPAKGSKWGRYNGALAIKSNTQEFMEDGEQFAFSRKSDYAPMIFVTQGPRGILFARNQGPPATLWNNERPQGFSYPLGCGDAVFAAMGLAVAAGCRDVDLLMHVMRDVGTVAAAQRRTPRVDINDVAAFYENHVVEGTMPAEAAAK